MKLSLTTRFNIVLSGVFLAGFGVAAYLSHALLKENARQEVLQDARILMSSAQASRDYTVRHVAPLLANQLKYQMLPESVPSFAATENLQAVRREFPAYSYKEATLNPTNPRDRAQGWEVDVVQAMRNNPALTEMVGDREDITGGSVFIARPIRISDAACLQCHSTVDAAPKTLLDAYGPANGFGWTFQDTVGAQIVTVPRSLAQQRAQSALLTFLASLLAVFVVIFAVFNLMFRLFITRPMVRLAQLADEVARAHANAAGTPAAARDEMALLSDALRRLRERSGTAPGNPEDR